MANSPALPQARPFIELDRVSKIFKSPAGEFTALTNIHLTFERGEFTSIIGKSGSGKSTLINMITGIDHPTAGTVRVGDVELMKMTEGQLAVWRGRAMGIVFQFFQLLPTLSILENTMLPMDYCNMYPVAERETRAMGLLKLLGLTDMADKLPAALSGGQQQIAAIARALANDPPVLVADEPTGNLDSQTEKLILDIFEDLAARGKTILIVTHDPILARRSTRRVLISDGQLVNEFVAQALPMLAHSQMLKISHMVTLRMFAPEAILSRQGAIDDGLYVITKGRVEVLVNPHSRLPGMRAPAPKIVGQIEPGQYFSMFELLEAENCDLSFRVSPEGPVEALCINHERFDQLIIDIPAIEHALRGAAAERGQQYCPPAPERKRLWGWL